MIAEIAEDPFLLANRIAGPPSLGRYTTGQLVACLLFPSRAPAVVLHLRVTGQTLDDVRRELRRREGLGAGGEA